VDAGDILVQRRFDLAEQETALTLNTKCYEAGFEGFEELVSKLRDGAIDGQAQGGPIRSYGLRDRPAGACALRWDGSAQSAATLVRALDFGTYANPVGVAKLSIGGRLLCVAQAEAIDHPGDSLPGVVIAADAQAITVATGEGALRVLRLATPDGQAVPLSEAQTDWGLRHGARLDVADAALIERLSDLNASVCRHEAFWQRRLETQSSIELPSIDRSAAPARPDYRSLDMTHTGVGRDVGVACLAGLLARLTDKDAFDIGYADAALLEQVRGVEAWFAPQVPLRVTLDFALPFSALQVQVASERDEVGRRGTFANDLVARSPELRAFAASRNPRTLPVAVMLVDDIEHAVGLVGSELTLAFAPDGSVSRWVYDAAKLSAAAVSALQQQFGQLVAAAMAQPQRPLFELPLLAPQMQHQILNDWNATALPLRDAVCVHRLIEEQAARTPDTVALTCEGRSLTYADLNARANQLARRLASLGVGPETLVGLMAERSVELMVGLLAIHKAGGAYVPLDPAYPRDRIAYMVEDSRVAVLLTQERLRDELPKHRAEVVCLDSDWPSVSGESSEPFDGGAQPHHLAYVIYTSGSTGKPKGVMVEHRNVVNFFAGMDRHLGDDGSGTWLAVTSLSFDISVLELCWTLARGFHVVMSSDEDRTAAGPPRGTHAYRPLDFSLFYFSSDESEGVADKYRLLLEGSRYADQHGFAAVWTPERHFHAFGGLYPNPAVTGAAVAAITERVQIRAGSVVLPLHHPLRVAEEWSVVDNISKGRVGISFASGWQPNDFVLKPENFADNKNVMLRNIEVVRRLWRGEKLAFDGPLGKPVETQILPRPVQKELPYWVTSAGNPETFAAAGRIGANVLTHLLGQTVDELKDKLAAYRQARKEAGHPGEGYVSLMLHTFVGPDEAEVRAKVRQPMIEYLRSSLNLVKQYAWSFPAFKNREAMGNIDLQTLSKDEMDALLEHSFERYYETSGLFGTPESCVAMIDAIKAIGVDDVACLIDFGVDSATVLAHLPYLHQLRKLSLPPKAVSQDHTLPALLQRHRVTHLQCTPSMARMLLMDDAAKVGMAGLQRMMVGGEALPPSLARELNSLIAGRVMNMYGPTETTIWSAVHLLDKQHDGPVPLGRPLANQSLYVLDRRQQPLPVGVPGELVIGGQGVVRGYLHRPELTAERFLPHPFQGGHGGRIYRTGDLARLREDGMVEFLGRLDHQVKVRGYRIELGEIESAALADPTVREAVVMAREDVPGDLRLVAYLVAAVGSTIDVAQLRERLRERLPEFMVPAHFGVLDAMPQTPNGKIDRKALPAPETSTPVPSQAFVAPAGGLEETIATIWKDVLKVAQVGTRDNFFDLGGHSLLAVQTHRRLKEVLQRDLSITDIFRFPTIQSLSAYLGDERADGAAAQQGMDRAQGRRAAMQRRQAARPGVTAGR
jgi:natural product biosynthesis luciferase-like monooxygenase protein